MIAHEAWLKMEISEYIGEDSVIIYTVEELLNEYDCIYNLMKENGQFKKAQMQRLSKILKMIVDQTSED